MARDIWSQRSGARLSAGPAAGVRRGDGSREATRQRAVVLECFRCAEVGDVDPNRAKVNRIRRLTRIRIVAGPSTLGTALMCSSCLGELEPMNADPLQLDATAG